MIVRVNVVLNRTVVDSDSSFSVKVNCIRYQLMNDKRCQS